ncbi:hypothetical protein HN011_005633 [Eciton burchellii]|nr:hypothetical protein HN011_005633 [Eciton burchellii]
MFHPCKFPGTRVSDFLPRKVISKRQEHDVPSRNSADIRLHSGQIRIAETKARGILEEFLAANAVRAFKNTGNGFQKILDPVTETPEGTLETEIRSMRLPKFPLWLIASSDGIKCLRSRRDADSRDHA